MIARVNNNPWWSLYIASYIDTESQDACLKSLGNYNQLKGIATHNSQ